MAQSPILYGLCYSPWTERACWALEAKKMRYRYKEHSPMLGEMALRFQSRKTAESKATVPLYVDGEICIGDSFEIMVHADKAGSGAPLFPDLPKAREWRDTIEPALEDMRIRVSRRILRSPEALKEAAATAVPTFLAGASKPVAALGVQFFARKYVFELNGEELEERHMKKALQKARNELSGSREYIGDSFSAVDMMITTLLQAVQPVETKYVNLGPATRKAWHQRELAEEFRDLLQWRDEIYRKHRHQS